MSSMAFLPQCGIPTFTPLGSNQTCSFKHDKLDRHRAGGNGVLFEPRSFLAWHLPRGVPYVILPVR